MDSTRHIVVDGWNVIHSDARLERLLKSESGEAAAAELARVLAPLHDFGGVRLTTVYDGVGDDISIVRRGESLTFSEVYTPSFMTADELIEQLCATSKNASAITVVSRDNLLCLTSSSFGATAITPDKLLEESAASSAGMRGALSKSNAASRRKWAGESPFGRLDTLALDIDSAMKNRTLLSKRMKKKMKRAQRAESEPASADNKNKAVKPALKDAPPPKKTVFRFGADSPNKRQLDELKKRFGK